MAYIEGTKMFKTWQGNYDFAVDGGGTGLPQTITLRSNDGPIPNGSVIVDGYVDVGSSCLSGTGTIALGVETTNDILAATAQAGLTAGRKSIIPVATGASSVKTTQSRSPTMTIATAAFTAGTFALVLHYR